MGATWLFGRVVAAKRTTEPEYAGDGFAVLHAASHHHADERAEGEEFNFNDFVLLGLRDSGTQAPRQVNGHGFGNEAGAGIEPQNPLPARSGVTRLLEQFAFGSGQLAFAVINTARAQLPQILLSGMAILAHQQHTRLGASFVHGHNYNRAGMPHDVPTATQAPRFQHLVGGDPEGRSTVDLNRRKHASFGFGM